MMSNRVFEYGIVDETAYLNWRTNRYDPVGNMCVMAEGYMDASKILLDACLEDNEDKKADAIIFPILFSFNQGIELYVKALLWSLNIVLGYKKKYSKKHDIRGIWLESKKKIKQVGFDSEAGRGEKEFHNMITVLENYINELYKEIANGSSINDAYYNIDFSRFPIDARFMNHYYVEKNGNEVVSLISLKDTIFDVADCLSSLSGYYYDLAMRELETRTVASDWQI